MKNEFTGASKKVKVSPLFNIERLGNALLGAQRPDPRTHCVVALCGRVASSFQRRFYLLSMFQLGTQFQVSGLRAVRGPGSNPERCS